MSLSDAKSSLRYVDRLKYVDKHEERSLNGM